MCVPCNCLDSEGKVLQTQTNARWFDFLASVLVACSSLPAGLVPFSTTTHRIWSLLSHYPVDVFYLLVQHCHSRQLSLNTEPQSFRGNVGVFLFTALLSPRMIKGFFPVWNVEAGWHYQFCLDFLLLSRRSRSGAPSDIRLAFHSSWYCRLFIDLLFKRVADPVGLHNVNSRGEKMIVTKAF